MAAVVRLTKAGFTFFNSPGCLTCIVSPGCLDHLYCLIHGSHLYCLTQGVVPRGLTPVKLVSVQGWFTRPNAVKYGHPSRH